MADASRASRLISEANPRSPITESYRTIRTNIQFASVVDDVKVILMTSSLPSEGKTSTASNVAVVSAQSGKRVLLIDADLRKPQVHQRFQISNLDGLCNVLIRERELESCIVESNTPGLYLLPSGPIPPNPSEMLSSRNFAELIETARNSFDLVIVDTPPVLSVADALVVTQVSDGVVFVVDSQKTSRSLAQKAVASLRQVNAKILGVVLNRQDKRSGDAYYYYQNYYSNANQQATV